MKKKILIVGGAGFIGHNLALYLLKNNIDYDVSIIDSLSINNFLSFVNEDFENKDFFLKILNERFTLLKNKNVPVITQDSREYELLEKKINEISPDVIIHLAAVSHANKSNINPHSTFDNSLRTLENVLNIIKNTKTKFIYFSSSMIYGDFNEKEVDEETECKPKGIYGTMKYSGELIIKSYSEVFDIDYTIIRPSALYGERCVSRRVTQVFIENAIFSKDIVVTGNKEKEKLDFTYIDDLCQGVDLSIKKEGSKNQIFNITFGDGRSISELIDILSNSFPNLKVIEKPRDKLVPIRGTLSIEKAKNVLGYKPKFNLEVGYKKYIDWYIKFYKQNF